MGDMTRNFSRGEFSCKCGCGYDGIKNVLVFALQIVRDHFDRKVVVSSGCRCGAHNKHEGGTVNSKHLFGIAADFNVNGVHPTEVANFVDKSFGGSNGLGRYKTFTHLDIRKDGRARWGE